MSSTDRIEKKILLRASHDRVWKAISEHTQFGAWFGVELDGPFAAGQKVAGRIVPTKVDPEAAKLQEPHKGLPFDIIVDKVEPKRLLSFRWHPFGVDKTRDYSKEERTLVTFELTEQSGGVLLTITETGFDKIPIERRAQAFAANDGGWTHQTKLIEKYLAQNS